jgi:hypothetical protein
MDALRALATRHDNRWRRQRAPNRRRSAIWTSTPGCERPAVSLGQDPGQATVHAQRVAGKTPCTGVLIPVAEAADG